MTERGLISVMMPVHDGAPYVAEALDSVLAQTDPNFEVVVIDDGSTDGTPEVVSRYSDPRIRLHPHGRVGYGRALVAAAASARGEFLAVLDADHVALPDRLATQQRYLAEHPGVALLGSAALEFDGKREWVTPVPCGPTAVRRALGVRNPFPTAPLSCAGPLTSEQADTMRTCRGGTTTHSGCVSPCSTPSISCPSRSCESAATPPS